MFKWNPEIWSLESITSHMTKSLNYDNLIDNYEIKSPDEFPVP